MGTEEEAGADPEPVETDALGSRTGPPEGLACQTSLRTCRLTSPLLFLSVPGGRAQSPPVGTASQDITTTAARAEEPTREAPREELLALAEQNQQALALGPAPSSWAGVQSLHSHLSEALSRWWQGRSDKDSESEWESDSPSAEEEEVCQELPRLQRQCVSPGCPYRVHSNVAYGSYCCIPCFESYGHEHGPACEKATLCPAVPAPAPTPVPVVSPLEVEGESADPGKQGQAGLPNAAASPLAPPSPEKGKENERDRERERKAQEVLEEAGALARQLQETGSALQRELQLAGTGAGRAGTSAEKLGEGGKPASASVSTSTSVPAGEVEGLARSLQGAAQHLLGEGVIEEARRVAGRLQDAAGSLLRQEPEPGALPTGQAEPRHAASQVREEAKRSPDDWRREANRLRASGDPEKLSELLSDAAKALLADGHLDDAKCMCREVETMYRQVGSRWRLGIALDRLARIHLKLYETLAADPAAAAAAAPDSNKAQRVQQRRREHLQTALSKAQEAVKLLQRIGHPREEPDLASARAGLAEARALEAAAWSSPGCSGPGSGSGGGGRAATDAAVGSTGGGGGRALAAALLSPEPELDGAAGRRRQKQRELEARSLAEAVAQRRLFFRQAPHGHGDQLGLAEALHAAAEALVQLASFAEAAPLAEEAAMHFRKVNAPKRLGTSLHLLAQAQLGLMESVGEGRSRAVPEARQHQVKAKTAACEAVSILAKGKTEDWDAALAACRCTMLRIAAHEQAEMGLTLGGGMMRSLRSKLKASLVLQPTFGFAKGLERPTSFAKFDIRPEVCLQVGGFQHGQVVRDGEGVKYVAIGVRLNDESGDSPGPGPGQLPHLWFWPCSLRQPSSCCFLGLPAPSLKNLLTALDTETETTEELPELRPEDFDAAEDSEGELVSLCHECLLPLGTKRYSSGQEGKNGKGEGEGFIHGECKARALLDRAQEEEKARVREEAQKKSRDREEYSIGWKPERMIPRNEAFFRSRKLPCPAGTKQGSLHCLILEKEEGKAPRLRIAQTLDPESSVNLNYLVTALQVRIKAGMAPYFSLDTPRADEPWQVKTFGPPWLKGTAVGEVLFQADYHLKELSMGDSLFEQPVAGMLNCWDFWWKQETWRGREWFVVKQAKVYVSEDNVLLPDVRMGVEAREQLANEQKQLVDKAVTSRNHPLVKYAEVFTHNFDLIAERKSVVFQLREVSRAAIVAKFIIDHKVTLEDFWLSVQEELGFCKMDLPFNYQDRTTYDVLVCDGVVKEQHGGVMPNQMWLSGGVDLNIDAFDLSMPIRVHRRIEPPDYVAIYKDPANLASAEELMRLTQRELRQLIKESGGSVPVGPADKPDLVEQLCALRPRDAEQEEADALPEEHHALVEDLRKLPLAEDMVQRVLEIVQGARAKTDQSQGHRSKRGFWEKLNTDSEEAAVLKGVFQSRLSDRQHDGSCFVPTCCKDSYVSSLKALLDEERQVQEKRREHFMSQRFVPTAPGPLFPTSWKAKFTMHFGRGSRGAAGVDGVWTSRLVESQSQQDGHLLLQSAKPFFDKSTEDGVRYRIYRRSALEARSIQLPGADEEVCAVYEVAEQEPIPASYPVSKATEFVRSGAVERDGDGDGDPAAGLRSSGSSSQPTSSSYRYFVTYETDTGDVIVTEQDCQEAGGAGAGAGAGAVTWEENPADLEERYARSRVLRVADCSQAGVDVGTLRGLQRSLIAQGGCRLLSSRRYARAAFALPGGEAPAAEPERSPTAAAPAPKGPPPAGLRPQPQSSATVTIPRAAGRGRR